MIVGSPPLEMGEQVWGLLRRSPGATSQRGYSMSDSQIHPLNESGVESSRVTQSLQGNFEICLCPEPHHRRDSHQLATPVAFLHLTVDQLRCHLPSEYFPPSATHLKPVSKMGGQGIEIYIETITREEREAARGQDPSQGVDHGMGRVLRAETEMEDGKDLRTGIDCQPQPQDVCVAAEPGAQFVQLDIRKLEMTEKVLVEALSVLPSAGQPGDDRGLTVAEDPFGSGRIQSFGQRSQHHGDVMGRGFQTVQGSVASSTERGAAGLTAKRLDLLGMAMLAISDQSVDVSIGDPEVRALLVETSEARGVYSLGCSPAAFHLTPGAYWRRGRSHT